VFEPTAIHLDLAEHAGLQPGRRLLQMRRALPAEIPFDVTTRTFRMGADEEAWLEVNNAAFAWHPEQGGWTLDTIRARESEPWFDPKGFLIHDRDGRIAAFCWTKVHDDVEPQLGEIYVIAVHPDFHGHGLGRALTLAGLDSLAERGLEVGMLYVDEDNHSAVGLYRALGFTVHHVDRAFVGDIAPRRSADGPSDHMADGARHEHGQAAEHDQS
jgi:mycothiol synthase